VKNKWFKLQPIDAPRYNTTASVMNNSAIYLMPGPGATAGNGSIFCLDLKPASKFPKDDRNYVKALA
jgi:hypothetical protein